MAKDTEDDPELAAMSMVLAALKPLEAGAQVRVVDWVVGKLGIVSAAPRKPRSDRREENNDEGDEEASNSQGEYPDFADLCSAASPATDAQKALVAGYWFQVCEGREDFGGQECNNQLKHFGMPVGNITRAFDSLKGSRLAMQRQKGGKTKQARKKYRLTHQGVEEVKRMLNG